VFFAFVFGLMLVSTCVFVYALAFRWFDPFEPEPRWLLVPCFLWGAFGATFGALIVNTIGGAFAYLFFGVLGEDFAMGVTATFIAPPVEETFKGGFLILVWLTSVSFLREIDGPLDGAIYGAMVGLGFTLTEDMIYILAGTAEMGAVGFVAVFFLRTVLGGLAHASFTAMIGIGIGIAIETRSKTLKIIAPVGGWIAAVGLHFLHNFLASFCGVLGVFVMFAVHFTFIALLFVVLYVLALRDRQILVKNLIDEVGKTLHPKELARTTSRAQFVPLWNAILLAGSPGGYFSARKKQLSLVKLAFLKQRLRRGESGHALSSQVHRVRHRIADLNARGVFVGTR